MGRIHHDEGLARAGPAMNPAGDGSRVEAFLGHQEQRGPLGHRRFRRLARPRDLDGASGERRRDDFGHSFALSVTATDEGPAGPKGLSGVTGSYLRIVAGIAGCVNYDTIIGAIWTQA